MMRIAKTVCVALATAAGLGSAPALAGEITGNGKEIEINGRSECAYSGQNDTPLGGGMDPGGRVQSYGYHVGYWGLVDPQEWDPNGEPFQRIPGFACNPNRWHDLNAGDD